MDTNNNAKTYLSIAAILGIVAIGFSAVIYSWAYSNSIQPDTFRSFSVSGQGKIVAVPDVAKFTFSVITQGGKDLGKSQNENVAKMNKIIDAVKAKGVDSKDIQTQQYSVEPRYQYYNCNQPIIMSPNSSVRPCPPPDIVGYTVTQTASVKIRDFAKIGEILAQTTENDANSVSQLSFTIDNPAKTESEAREKAIAQAKEKAEKVAQAGGFKIGKLLSIDEGGGPIPYYDKALGMGGAEMRSTAAIAPTIEPGSQEVSITVNLRYEIK